MWMKNMFHEYPDVKPSVGTYLYGGRGGRGRNLPGHREKDAGLPKFIIRLKGYRGHSTAGLRWFLLMLRPLSPLKKHRATMRLLEIMRYLHIQQH